MDTQGFEMCTVLDYSIGHFQDERKLYMVLEYIHGGELFSHLRREGRFADDHARYYAAEIVLAFAYMHTMSIVYRDLKPENLLITTTGHMKITGAHLP